jgi:UDP-N-acetylglucosamine--N-acetylmuramyl-(pentapeptide) pyrophosphoryl-undecaprenol N-acetylglucosamine transferase
VRVWFAGGGTGGHLYPGLAIARALVAQAPAIEPFFIGAKRGVERTVLPNQGFGFDLLDLHPLYRRTPLDNWKTLRGAIGAWRRLSELARERPPALVFGTGGYAMGLTAAWARVHGVPVVQVVADVVPGLTARWVARWSRELYLGFPEAAERLTGGEKFSTGNPIAPPPNPRPNPGAARAGFALDPSLKRVVLVFGGSQGAKAINEAVAGWVRSGVGDGIGIIWATGPSQHSDFASCAEPGRVVVTPYLSPIADAYAAADLAVTRAGAITCAELSAWGLPSIMVPLPTAAADHQTTNARALEQAGASVCFPQSGLTSDGLRDVVEKILGSSERLVAMRAAAEGRARPSAAADIAARVMTLVSAELDMKD